MLALTDAAELCLRELSNLTGSKRAITSHKERTTLRLLRNNIVLHGLVCIIPECCGILEYDWSEVVE